MIANITQSHIKDGVPGDGCDCALAKCLQAMGYSDATVESADNIQLGNGEVWCAVEEDELQEWLDSYDSADTPRGVAPRSFELRFSHNEVDYGDDE